MHCTASGRALLFDSDDELVEALTEEDLRMPISAPAAPRTLDELLERLHAERSMGYAMASEEVEIGLTSVGVPIRDHTGELTAVINISGPHITPDRQNRRIGPPTPGRGHGDRERTETAIRKVSRVARQAKRLKHRPGTGARNAPRKMRKPGEPQRHHTRTSTFPRLASRSR